MDREGRYLKHPDQGRDASTSAVSLVTALSDPRTRADLAGLHAALEADTPTASRPEPQSIQYQHRLEGQQIEELIAAYQAGSSVSELAERFNLHTQTVAAHLQRAGVPTRRTRSKLSPGDIVQMVDLYANGQSTAVIGRQFNVNAETARRVLVRAGVTLRPRGRRPARTEVRPSRHQRTGAV